VAAVPGDVSPTSIKNKIIVGKFEERIPFERPQLTWEGNIKLVLEN
jgi:hypothetical protein